MISEDSETFASSIVTPFASKISISRSFPGRQNKYKSYCVSKESRSDSPNFFRRTKRSNSFNEVQRHRGDEAVHIPFNVVPYNHNDHSFGLSKSLSTESIRNACEFYDDELSDDDLIEVHKIPADFKNQSLMRMPFKASYFNSSRKKHKGTKDRVQTYLNKDTDEKATPAYHCQEDDNGIYVLNELDAVLNIHEAPQLNTSHEMDVKIEDCLLDLDSYLEQMDDSFISNDDEDVYPSRGSSVQKCCRMNGRNRTLPLNKTLCRIIDIRGACATTNCKFERGSQVRNTTNFDLRNVSRDLSCKTMEAPNDPWLTKGWRRNSMCRTSPLKLPADLSSPTGESNMVYSGNVRESSAFASEFGSTMIGIKPTNTCSESDSLRRNCEGEQSSELRRCFSQNHFTVEASFANHSEMLTHDNILNNLLIQSGTNDAFADRPRQFGRRAGGYPFGLSNNFNMSSWCSSNRSCALVNYDHRRPLSAPASAVTERVAINDCDGEVTIPESISALYMGSEASSVRSSRNHSPISIVSSSDSISTTTSVNGHIEQNIVTNENLQPHHLPLDPNNAQTRTQLGINCQWPHSFSRTLALTSCTLGLFNTCRFAVLTIHYGGNFVLQFLLLSILFGIPLFWLQMCLGAKIKSGPVSMWKISPICRGIGIALVTVHCCMAIYSTVVIGWLLIYLRDSFPSKGSVAYRWQGMAHLSPGPSKLAETVASYFNLVVLQRLQFVRGGDGSSDVRFRVNDRLAFNLAILWASVFLILCKGLKSFGKVLFALGLLPLIALVALTGKFLYVVDPSKLQNIFAAADFDDFLVNSKTWTAAAQETFLTWGLLGASVIAVTSRACAQTNDNAMLRKDAILSVLITLFGLSVAALLGLCCIQVLSEHSYVYVPGSYEHPESYIAVYFLKDSPNTNILSFPSKWVPHYSSFVGEIYRRPSREHHQDRESGYQAMRLISELFPVVASLCNDAISWIWIAIAFACFTLFGLAQLCVMWKPISSALGNSTSSVLLSCVTGLLLTIPFATEVGISILHYMDLLLGGSWFLPLLWAAQIFGVFLIRGRPYNGDDLVNDLRMSPSMSAFLALSWNVLLPIGLITLAIIDYKTSQSNQFYYWRGKSYFSYWARKVAGLSQVGLLLLVPVTALVQIYRYLANGPPDILDRIQLLYRPSYDESDQRRRTGVDRNLGDRNGILQGDCANDQNIDASICHNQEDAPPKYTPPPSYTTATGARLAKIFRQSVGRSVRRILGDPERSRETLSIDTELSEQQSLPPNYTTVLAHLSATTDSRNQDLSETNISERPRPNLINQYSLSLGRKMLLRKQSRDDCNQRPSSAPRALQTISNIQRPYTAEDVVTVLRASTRLQPGKPIPLCHQKLDVNEIHNTESHRSVENLILNAEPLSHSQAIRTDNTEQDEICHEENNTSVI